MPTLKMARIPGNMEKEVRGNDGKAQITTEMQYPLLLFRWSWSLI